MMLPSTSARSPLFALALTASAALIFIFGIVAWQRPSPVSFPPSVREGITHDAAAGSEKPAPAIHDVFRLLYAPLKVSPSNATFTFYDQTTENLTTLRLPPKPRYTKPLAKDVLILDLETRPLGSTKHYKAGEYDWTKINHVSGGIFSHYTYAQVHGYDYKFIRAHEFEDRHATWIKPSALAQHIRNYKFIVFLDADAIFRFMHLPMEWMLNYWNIKPEHSITMALDPWQASEAEYNSDRFNRTYTNTGFMVVQNNNKIMEILKAWHECPDDTRYAGCSYWKEPKFHEQSAFGEHIRYDYEKYVKELPCAEANGFPGVSVSQCEGRFVRHYWFEKATIKEDFQNNIMNALTLPIQRMFAENTGGIVHGQLENVLPES